MSGVRYRTEDGIKLAVQDAVTALMRRVPQVSIVPAYLIGVGLRPEHAPPFAGR